ncbi:MAG: ribose-5-phosphate isomerase A [Streptococcus sp.]
MDDIDSIDVTVDGADEVDLNSTGLRWWWCPFDGKNCCHTYKEYIWVVDESKMVDQLGAFKLPVEWFNMVLIVCIVSLSLRTINHHSDLRKQGDRFVTDMKNFIIDLDLGKINNPVALGDELKAMTGVVEHGLFNGMVNKVIVAGKDGVKIVEVKD